MIKLVLPEDTYTTELRAQYGVIFPGVVFSRPPVCALLCVATAGCIGEDSGWVGIDKNLVVENQMTSWVHLRLVVEP